MIPLFHDFRDEQVVIFGGGQVAARKAALFATEADVLVLSREFADRFREIDCRTRRLEVTPANASKFLSEAFLVIPATDDPTLNEEIAAQAREAGALVNRVDATGRTVTPSVIDGENVTVGISTEGESPAVSKYLRKRLESEIEALDAMVPLQAELRDDTADQAADARREFLWNVLEDERIRDALAEGEWERARRLAATHRP